MTLYLACYNDKYELPIFIGNGIEMAQWLGISESTLYCAMNRIKKGQQHLVQGYRMDKIKIKKREV